MQVLNTMNSKNDEALHGLRQKKQTNPCLFFNYVVYAENCGRSTVLFERNIVEVMRWTILKSEEASSRQLHTVEVFIPSDEPGQLDTT